ncbi:MAG: ABC-ATPase domain-containing protein [Coprococcus sp.]|nr:ABC-ATPase domain-containing protein [Coprococcus sp.]
MKSSIDLEKQLMSLNRKSYPAYKDLRGSYQFSDFQLNIDHVQGDPFAAPSKLSVQVKKAQAGFPEEMYAADHRRIALQDYLTRQFARAVGAYTFQAKGSGKSGLIGISRCGQEVLERTALTAREGELVVRFEVGFPANGRTINAYELKKILFEYLPQAVRRSLFYKNLRKEEVSSVVKLAEDQQAIREELKKRRLAAFVANGAILPRESGVSQRPMKDAVPFQSPGSMEVEMELPYKGKIKGMGIPEGITLIVGGGYHGKSTLLKALEQGIYNHIAGDGREYVITEDTAVKIRAEDGRAVSHVNISPFINDLPNKKDTVNFSTEDASGSTSQAANVVEAVQAGAKSLLIDEDTCATNFMVRDSLMQAVVSGDKEPITPFTLQAKELSGKHGVSVILVAGSSGSYFYIADKILQMDSYRAYDITEKVKKVISRTMEEKPEEGGKISIGAIFEHTKNERRMKAKRMERKHDQVKIKQFGKDSFSIGRDTVDLKYVEQILDSEQTTTLSYCLKYVLEQAEAREQNVTLLVEELWKQIRIKGLEVLCQGSYLPVSMAQIRKQDIFACVNRFRGFV